MSSFYCDMCGALISDSPSGYVTGCVHFPLEQRKKVHCEPKPKPKPSRPPEDFDSELDEDYG